MVKSRPGLNDVVENIRSTKSKPFEDRQMKLHTNRQGKSRFAFRLLLALLLGLSITSSQWAFVSRGSAAVTLNLKSASQIQSEANSYDAAIRDLSAISLSTVANLRATQDILEAQVPKLKFGRTKLLAIALSDATFIGSIKAKVFDKQSAEKFALELAQEKEAIYKLSGASAVRDRIKAVVSADVTKLQKLAQLFKENAETLNRQAEPITSVGVAVGVMSAAVVVAILIAAAMVAVPGLTAALAVLASGGAALAVGVATAAAVAAGAIAIVAATASSAGAAVDQAQDKVAECENKADSKYKRCKSSAQELIGPAVGVALEACKAKWLVDVGECLVLD
jgi:hypothetical protein